MRQRVLTSRFEARPQLAAMYAFSQIEAVRKQPNDKRGERDSEDNYEVHV